MKNTFFLLCAFIFSISVYAQNTYVFLGSYNKETNTDGIYVYQLDPVKGKLTKVTSNNSMYNPSYLTLSPNGKYVYACTETQTKGAGSVSSYAFDPEKGTLTFLNSQKSGGENPVYLSITQDGKWLINGNYTEASISAYPLSADGTINPYTQLLQFTEGSNINPKRQDKAHIHSAVFSPQQDYIFFPDLGADKIRSYSFDNLKTQPLQTGNTTTATPGSGPRHFTFHPNGKFAYCIEELGGAVSAYRYSNGKLDSIQRIITHPLDYKGLVMSADIHIAPDGKFLYASNRGEQNNLSIFSIQEDGTLKSVGTQSTLGEHPRIFAIDPSGQFLIVTNLITGNAVVFRRDLQTGLLKKVGKQIKIKNVSCVQIRTYT